jgi:mannose-6-phosphate isomerase-like protein (cupin superfamily)
MTTETRDVPVVLDAAAMEAIPEEPLGALPGIRHRSIWTDGTSKAGVMRVDAGHHLGVHAHRRHHHHIWVLEGRAKIVGQDLGPGGYAHVPKGIDHDIDARATEGCKVFYLYLEGCAPSAEA